MEKVADFKSTKRQRHGMKLRLTSSREEKSVPDSTAEQAPVDPNSATSKVSRNPLILDIIFAKLNLPDLKTSRLVCHEWDDVGVTLLGKRAYLQVTQIFSYRTKLGIQMTPVNEKLFGRLLITDTFDPSVPTNKKADVITKMFTDVDKVSRLTHEIKFAVSVKRFLAAFLEGIRTLKSPRIQTIGIFIPHQRSCATNIPAQAYQKLPPQPNLTSLKFNVLANLDINPIEFIRFWTDSAPNLTTLDVAEDESYSLNLEGCKNLKVLKYKYIGPGYRSFYRPTLDLAIVTKMLAQVKDSLIELTLSVDDSDFMEQVNIIQPAEVPVMSTLTTLSIPDIDVYPIRNFFNEDHFPKLETLSVNNGKWQTSLASHFLWRPHKGVKSLALTFDLLAWGQEKFEEKMIHLFPSVKKFDLTMELRNGVPNADFNRILEQFQAWGLERTNVLVTFVDESSLLIGTIRNVAAWKGVKRVRFEDVCINEETFFPLSEDLISLSRGFERVEIFGDEVPEIEERIRPMLEASGAQIHFYGR
ncbi:uncharacterized protein LOC110857257 isoform X1 [Folsomia candida]|uniref:uncharacterized protein LOC110857257 isoform X1 n=1 Tax=Folsomia candida TaxID=158441 RepID=UPI000B900251|nr:uncharacterized protein LOC110857257 isoform X1 [Folsomia candida]